MNEDDNVFDSVTWDSAGPQGGYEPQDGLRSTGGFHQSEGSEGHSSMTIKWSGYLSLTVADPIKELEGTKDMYISYKISGQTNLPTLNSTSISIRRRFQDFTFLRDNLLKDLPACVVPPLPGKHRLEYVTGDRFSTEFVDRRKSELQRFLTRIALHPVLQRSTLLASFLESTEWHVIMHRHLAHPPGPEPSPTVFDNISDTLINAFARVRKPDGRFMEMKERIDKFEEGMIAIDRTWSKIGVRTNDLSQDYHELAVSVQGLGFLESGITDPLNRFSTTLLEFSALMKHSQQHSITPFLHQLNSLLQYSHSNRAVLRLRDQKQLDFEELSEWLANASLERNRLSARVTGGRAGPTGMGLGAYIRDRVEAIRGGVDDDRARVERVKKLDTKIKSLEEEVTKAQEQAEEFNNETLKEQLIFQHAKRAELKQSLGDFADGQIEIYKQAMEEWERIIPAIQRIRVDV